MEVFDDSSALPRRLRDPVVAIGYFDGIHLGHRRLLEIAVGQARQRGGEAVVMTFAPHPARLLAPECAPPELTGRARKLELIAESGVDVCIVEPFTRKLASLSDDEFVDEILIGRLGAREVVVGWSFTFGRRQIGNASTLRSSGEALGFDVHIVPPVTLDDLPVSSTRVREVVRHGDVETARRLLGRPFEIEGRVVRGAGRGRTIGVPTANVLPDSELLPKPGVYAAEVLTLGRDPRPWPAAVNLGQNPTFGGTAQSLEAHLLDFEGDLLGERVRVSLCSWLREEARFESADALVAQIRRDLATTRDRLGPPPASVDRR